MQSDSNRAPTPTQRGVAVVALLAGAVLLVSVILKLTQGVAADAGAWTRGIARLIDVLGSVPMLVFALGLSGLGGIAVARREPTPLGRAWIGLLGAVFGLSLVLGAVAPGYGGEFGAFFPRRLGGLAAGIAGFATGVILFLAALWVALRGAIPATGENSVHSGADLDALTGRPDDDGVTTAEATALGHRAIVKPIASSIAEEVSALRSRGGIPAGTKPLTTEHAHSDAASSPARAPAGGGAAEGDAAGAQPAGAYVASPPWSRGGAGSEAAAVEPPAEPTAAAHEPRATQPEARAADVHSAVAPSAAESRAVDPLVEPSRPRWESLTEAGDAELEVVAAEQAPVRAKWEQEPLFEPAVAAAAESVVEAAAVEPEPTPEPALAAAQPEFASRDEELASATADPIAEPRSLAAAEQELDAVEEPETAAAELDAAAAAELAAASSPALETALTEPAPAEHAKPAPVQQPTLFELEEPELDPVPEPVAPRTSGETAAAEVASAAAMPSSSTAAPLAASPSPAEELPERELVPAPRAAEQELRLVTDPEPIVELVAEEPPIEVEVEAEASADEASHDPLVGASGHALRLRECGLLFIDRQRVAVSMLQREFGMDFKQATQMLDELQQLGLIGPYMGGTRRDILMDRESWLAAVARI